jgi:putative flippase GtrA
MEAPTVAQRCAGHGLRSVATYLTGSGMGWGKHVHCAETVKTGTAPARRAVWPSRPKTPVVAQYVQFCIVGLSNALVDLGVLNALLLIHPTRSTLGLLADNTLAVVLAIANSWVWNTRWTFRGQVAHSRRQHALFVVQALVNIAINNLILVGVTGVLPPTQGISSLLGNNLAKLAAMLVASSTSFLLLRTVVFRTRSAADRPPDAPARLCPGPATAAAVCPSERT